MSTEKFETFAQGNLENHRSAIDAEALWATIEPVLHPERKRRSFFWIWLLAGLGLTAAIFYFSTTDNTATPIVTQTNSASQNKAVSPHTATKHSTPQEIITTAATSATTTMDNTDQPLYNAKSNVERKSPSESMANPALSQPTIYDSNSTTLSKVPTSPKAIKTQSLPIAKAKDPNLATTLLLSENTDDDKSAQVETTPIETETKVEAAIEEVAPPKSDVVETPITEPNIEAMSEEVPDEVEGEKPEDKKPGVKPPPAPRRFSSRFAFGLGVRGGISSMITDFIPDTDTASVGESIRAFREDSETKLETLDFGLEVLLKSKKTGFYAATGVDYQRGARRLNFDDLQQSVDSIEGVTAIYVNPISGDSTKEYGMLAVTTTTMNVKEIFNYIHFVNIPVSVGYAFKYDNWSFGVEAGALFNIMTKYKGQLNTSPNEYYAIKDDPLKWFKKNVGPSFRGSLQIGYSPSDNFQIVAGPSFRSFVTVSTGVNPLQQRQASLGFQVAARYWLDY